MKHKTGVDKAKSYLLQNEPVYNNKAIEAGKERSVGQTRLYSLREPSG